MPRITSPFFPWGIGSLLSPVMGEEGSLCVRKEHADEEGHSVAYAGPSLPLVSQPSAFSEDNQIRRCICLDLAQGKLGPKI